MKKMKSFYRKNTNFNRHGRFPLIPMPQFSQAATIKLNLFGIIANNNSDVAYHRNVTTTTIKS